MQSNLYLDQKNGSSHSSGLEALFWGGEEVFFMLYFAISVVDFAYGLFYLYDTR